jgi:N-acetylglucosamine kinase-like BadF-type ATPase
LLGDDGSAFWIGREWLRAHGDPVARRYAVRRDAVSAIAGLARRVVVAARDGDPVARRIVRGAQARLAAQAVTVVRALRLPAPVSIGGAGSVMGDAWFAAGVRRALARAGLHARWRAAGETPVEAALRLAAASVARPR